MTEERIAVFGGDALHASITSLGFACDRDGARLAVVDLSDDDAVAEAATLAPDIARVFVCGGSRQQLLGAVGIPSERVARSSEPAVLGPVVARALPHERRTATRAVGVTGLRGGVGRTLLVTNLARRVATRLRVCVVDATGTGASAWWLRCLARPWSELEPLADELSADQLAIVASDAAPNVRVVGGRGTAPGRGVLDATIRVATHLDDLVLVDLPLLCDTVTARAFERVDRRLVLAYEDPLAVDTLDGGSLSDAWLIASQSAAPRIGRHDAFRALPRDEAAVRSALSERTSAKGALGRAYDDLAELLVIDAT